MGKMSWYLECIYVCVYVSIDVCRTLSFFLSLTAVCVCFWCERVGFLYMENEL